MCNTASRGPVQDRATSTRTLGEGPGVLSPGGHGPQVGLAVDNPVVKFSLGWHRPLGRHGLSRTGVGVEETKDLAPRWHRLSPGTGAEALHADPGPGRHGLSPGGP